MAPAPMSSARRDLSTVTLEPAADDAASLFLVGAPEVEPVVAVEAEAVEPVVAPEDDLRAIRRHLAVLANPASPEEALSVSTDALLTVLSGGYEPETRLEIVKALFETVDASLHSLLAEHVKDLRDEAEAFDDTALVKQATRLLIKLEPATE